MSSGISIRQLICRACLKMHKYLYYIFEPYENNQEKLISDILMDCTAIKIKIGDGLPTNICSVCLETLTSIYNFRSMVNESDTKLQHFYGTKTDKEFSACDTNKCSVKVEESAVTYDQLYPLNGNNTKSIKEENTISLTENKPVSTENIQRESLKHCNMNLTENVEVKENDNDKMQDFCDENSSSSSDNVSYFRKRKEIHDEQIPLQKRKRNKKKIQKNKELSAARKSLDFSEYEHLKRTLNEDEKKKTKVFCKLCKKLYKYKYFSTHIRIHIGDLPHKCDVCGKGFVMRTILKQHKVIHTENKPYTCQICNKSFKTKGSLSLHNSVHIKDTPFACDICNKQYKTESALKTHLLRHTTVQHCVCELCGKSFSDRYALRKHTEIHSGNKYKCMQCNKFFKTRQLLKGHTKRHSNDRPYVCSTCNKGFKDKSVLEAHFAVHTGERAHSCKICGKTFRQASCIPRHMRTHTGETPFPCDKCPAVFRYSHHLKNHIKVHT